MLVLLFFQQQYWVTATCIILNGVVLGEAALSPEFSLFDKLL